MTRLREVVLLVFLSIFMFGSVSVYAADTVEILGVTLPAEKIVAGKTLTLNGVAYRKAFGIVKVYVVGLYLENPTDSAEEIITSEQVKHLYTHYLTDKATAVKLRDGFIELITECNPPDLVERRKADIERYASWLDKDMKPGLTSVSTYIPGQGLTLEYQGEVRGTIAEPEFMQMYYRYNVGPKADRRIRDGLLGKK